MHAVGISRASGHILQIPRNVEPVQLRFGGNNQSTPSFTAVVRTIVACPRLVVTFTGYF